MCKNEDKIVKHGTLVCYLDVFVNSETSRGKTTQGVETYKTDYSYNTLDTASCTMVASLPKKYIF